MCEYLDHSIIQFGVEQRPSSCRENYCFCVLFEKLALCFFSFLLFSFQMFFGTYDHASVCV